MPGGVLQFQDRYVDDSLVKFFKSFDLRIGTLECAIGTDIPFEPLKLKEYGGNNNVCFARDEDFYRVTELGFDVLSLGNNHSFDLGEEGLKNTIRQLKENGILHCGAGLTLAEASRPAVVESANGKTIAVIGFCVKGLSPVKIIAATDNSYGIYQPSIEEVIADIHHLKHQYDYVFVLPHWGTEHVFFPPSINVDYAKQMIDAGADGVFSSHSHRISTHFLYKGKPVFMGMGNFLAPDSILCPPRFYYYPSSVEEFLACDKCTNYPKSVKRNTICKKGEDSRTGEMVVVSLDDGRVSHYLEFVYLLPNNVLHLYSSVHRSLRKVSLRIQLVIAGWVTQHRYLLLFFTRVSRRISGKLGDFGKEL